MNQQWQQLIARRGAPPVIKFCGFTRAEDVDAAVGLGVELIGFNFARGPRRITPAQAALLRTRLPPSTVPVALFLDADEAAIRSAMAESGCAVIQLHGAEPAALLASLRRDWPVIRAVAVRSAADLEAARTHRADALLLDAAVGASSGGTGATWDHALLQGAAFTTPLMLAGGLRPETVAAGIAAAHPWAVDVASGIESAPAQKDAAKMQAFVAAVRGPRPAP